MTDDSPLRKVLREAQEKIRRFKQAEAIDAEITEAHAARIAAQMELKAREKAQAGQLSAAVASAAAATLRATQAKPGPSLSRCIDAFVVEHVAKKSWTAKTAERWAVTFRLLSECLGDPPINTVDRSACTAFFVRLRRLPSNAQKKQGIAGLPFLELTEPGRHSLPVLSDETVNGHMTRASGFFKWALRVEAYGLRSNPAEGLLIKNPMGTKRKPFTDAQLVALFSHENYRNRTFLHPHHYWLMPLAALTGMRLNEACQLRLSDFIQVRGVDVIRCADLGEDRRRKNENATRRVPVHDELKRLGLLRWVEAQRAKDQTQLFPELKAGRDGYGQQATKWFGRYRVKCGITGKQESVFHSFRHYFISKRMDRDIVPHKIAAVAGHETGMVTGDIYWSDRDVVELQAVVNAVGLPADVLPLLPVIEEVEFKKVKRRPPSRLGARKSREKRIADAAKKKAGKAVA